MGVQGLWPILWPASDNRSLLEFAANEGFRPQSGPSGGLKLLTVGVDVSTWMHSVCPVSQFNHAGAGPNPELCALFIRLAAVLAMPMHVFFVFDGPGRPPTKRGKHTGGKSHWLSHAFQELLDAFGFRWCQAPGEAEAELAALSQRGFIDMVLTTDNDTLIFGSTCVARCRRFDNIKIYTEHAIAGCQAVHLTRADLVLMALVRSGDYNEGLPGCGIKIAHGLTKYKLAEPLLDAFSTMSRSEFVGFLPGWRNTLRRVLRADPEGLLGRKYTDVASVIPDSFPDYGVLQSYVMPLTSFSSSSSSSANRPCPYHIESRQPSLGALATLCERHFWKAETIVVKMRATIWEGALVRLMCGLPKQLGDQTVANLTLMFIHRSLVNTTGSKLVVYNVRYHGRQFGDAVRTALSLPRSKVTGKLDGPEDEELKYLTLPACVVEYALPVEAQRFTDLSTEQTPALDAGREARERAETRAFLWSDDLPPVPSNSPVSRSNVIDLTTDTDAENAANESDDDSEVEIIIG
ncbi:PIN domain-like protein [Melanogaster broomeanus]|nr:PIN domain-like protein [Melanogaster broomeanus]